MNPIDWSAGFRRIVAVLFLLGSALFIYQKCFSDSNTASVGGVSSQLFDGTSGKNKITLAVPHLTHLAPPVSKSPPQPRVAIIGAGIAGTVTAYKLKMMYGIHSEIYEARNRVGGRTFSVPPTATSKKEKMVDMGAGGTYVNTTDKDLRETIHELGLNEIPAPKHDETVFLLRDGAGKYQKLSEEQLYSKFEPVLKKIAEDQGRLGIHPGQFEKKLTSEMGRVNSQSMKDYLDSIKASTEFRQFVQYYYGIEDGTQVDHENAMHLLSEMFVDKEKKEFELFNDKYSDEALTVEGGTQHIAIEIAKNLKNVHLNYILTSIESTDQKKFKLTFKTPTGEQVVWVDYVICTIPFPVLRKSVKLQVSNVPVKVRNFIETSVMGQNSKMDLFFKTPIWKNVYHKQGSVATDQFFTADCDFTQKSPEGCLTVYFYTQQNYSGTADVALRQQVLSVLERVYPGISGQYQAMVIADWPSDPYSLGSYSGAKAVGQWTQGWPTVEDMRVGHLIFAGEALSGDRKTIGYMEGAAESAFSAAKITRSLIKEELKDQKKTNTLQQPVPVPVAPLSSNGQSLLKVTPK